MSKNPVDRLFDFIIAYKLRFLIITILIILAIIIFITKKDMDNEYKKYGYTGFCDTIKYDDYTKENIPKNEISTYNNDNKFITNKKGQTIYFYQIKQNKLKECKVNGKDKTGETLGATSNLEDFVKEYVRGLYREQNNLEYKD